MPTKEVTPQNIRPDGWKPIAIIAPLVRIVPCLIL